MSNKQEVKLKKIKIMKKFVKEVTWKVAIGMAWFVCTPWFNNPNVGLLEIILIMWGFLVLIDLAKWGLKK